MARLRVTLRGMLRAMLLVRSNDHRARASVGVVQKEQEAREAQKEVEGLEEQEWVGGAVEVGRTCRRCWRECLPSRSAS
jgi:hypothetical protein